MKIMKDESMYDPRGSALDAEDRSNMCPMTCCNDEICDKSLGCGGGCYLLEGHEGKCQCPVH